MVTVTKTYNLEIKGNLFAFTEAEARELFNALDSVLNGKTHLKPGEWIPISSDPWSRVQNYIERYNRDKFKL